MLKSDKELYEKIKTVSSIKGVGIMTVTKVVAETAGFALIKKKNQITSYSGYDIIHDESGTHKGKTKISKKVIHKSEVLSICLHLLQSDATKN
ncbi:MAG: transposase [Ignavibacteria bacterium]|nr:transposase [Ignavibacteria bacterium]